VVTITEGTTPVTVVNVFTVAEEDQAKLVSMLDEFAVTTMRQRPGFISTSVHASLDRSRVINYAQWETQDDLLAALSAPETQEALQAIVSLAATEPRLYEVAKVYEK
jgi:quinol monooxygenase YgiN